MPTWLAVGLPILVASIGGADPIWIAIYQQGKAADTLQQQIDSQTESIKAQIRAEREAQHMTVVRQATTRFLGTCTNW